MAYELMKDERVQSELKRLLDEAYPDLDRSVGSVLQQMITAPIKGSPEAKDSSVPSMSWREKIAAVEYLGRIKGYEAPRKSASLKVQANVPAPTPWPTEE